MAHITIPDHILDKAQRIIDESGSESASFLARKLRFTTQYAVEILKQLKRLENADVGAKAIAKR